MPSLTLLWRFYPVSMNEHDRTKRPGARGLGIVSAGEYLGVSKWTVRTMINNGRLPYFRIGRRLLIDVHDLDVLIEREKQREII